MSDTRLRGRRRLLQSTIALLFGTAAVLTGVMLEVSHKRQQEDALVAKWLHAEAMPFGGVMVEPQWTLELAATLDNPHAVKLVIDELRKRRGPVVIETLRARFSLVENEDGARFDAPLMTTPDDHEGVRAMARFAEAAMEGLKTGRGSGRGLASVAE